MRRHACRLTVAVFVLASPPIVAAAQDAPPERAAASPIGAFVREGALRFDLPEAWIWAVIRIESRGDPRAISPAGAMGLMQVMPATWAAMRARYGLGGDPFDTHDNIIAGAAFLRLLHDRYGNPAAMLAAYNAGPGRYDDWLARRRPLPAETVAYVAQFGDMTGGQPVAAPAPDPLAWTRAPLFIGTRQDAPATPSPRTDDAAGPSPQRIAIASDAPANPLFVSRSVAASPQSERAPTSDRREADAP